ncbi:magnesium transporter CorA family protein [Fundidesulfovibrio butyratiphilus]
MITIHGPDGTIRPLDQGDCSRCWIDLTEPETGEIRRVTELARLDETFIEHALDLHERPRIEIGEEATLMVIRAPILENRQQEPRHSTVPVGILLGPDAIVTVCGSTDAALSRILDLNKKRQQGFRAEACVCHIIREVALLFMKYLKEISLKIQEVERGLAQSLSNDDLKVLLNLQKSVTYFHAALKTNDFIIDRIIRKGLCRANGERLSFTEDDVDELEIALIDTRQGIYMSKIFTEVLNSISSVYSSIISNNLNKVMKFLTSLSVIIMIPTLITSMYGMNVELPLQRENMAFLLVMLGAMALTLVIVFVLRISKVL